MNDNLLQNVETDEFGLQSFNDMHVQEASILTSADETDLYSSFVDDGEQIFPDINNEPSAVLQTGGEFMCSCCGVMMKCAQAIKRHISTHVSLQSSRLPTTVLREIADNTDDVSEDDVTWTETTEQLNKANKNKSVPTPDVSVDSSERKPKSNTDVGTSWRSFPCNYCDTWCISSALLRLHRLQMHKPHKCQKCGKVIAGRRNFSQHVRQEHPGQHILKVTVFTGLFKSELCIIFSSWLGHRALR